MAPGQSWKLAPSKIVLPGKLKDNCSTVSIVNRPHKLQAEVFSLWYGFAQSKTYHIVLIGTL